MEVFQVLHIPTSGYITSSNRAWNYQSVLFTNRDSSEQMIRCIVEHHSYIAGAPLSDYYVGGLQASTTEFCVEEFESIPVQVLTLLNPPQKVLTVPNIC